MGADADVARQQHGALHMQRIADDERRLQAMPTHLPAGFGQILRGDGRYRLGEYPLAWHACLQGVSARDFGFGLRVAFATATGQDQVVRTLLLEQPDGVIQAFREYRCWAPLPDGGAQHNGRVDTRRRRRWRIAGDLQRCGDDASEQQREQCRQQASELQRCSTLWCSC